MQIKLENMPSIARDLGYVLNGRFITVFRDFTVQTVAEATVTEFLFVIAQNSFGAVTPPLEKQIAGH